MVKWLILSAVNVANNAYSARNAFWIATFRSICSLYPQNLFCSSCLIKFYKMKGSLTLCLAKLLFILLHNITHNCSRKRWIFYKHITTSFLKWPFNFHYNYCVYHLRCRPLFIDFIKLLLVGKENTINWRRKTVKVL